MTSIKKHIVFFFALIAILITSIEFPSHLQSIPLEEISIESEIEEEISESEIISISATTSKFKKVTGGNAVAFFVVQQCHLFESFYDSCLQKCFERIVTFQKNPFYILYCCLLINRI